MCKEPQFSQLVGENIASLIKENDKIAVFFWRNKHHVCDKMRTVLENLYADLVNPDLPEIGFTWIDADERRDVCEELSVFFFPTIIFFREGKEIARFTCLTSKDAIRHQIEEIMGKRSPVPSEVYF